MNLNTLTNLLAKSETFEGQKIFIEGDKTVDKESKTSIVATFKGHSTMYSTKEEGSPRSYQINGLLEFPNGHRRTNLPLWNIVRYFESR